MTARSKTNLKTYVDGLLADNNAGLISAADVRNSILDTIDSIESIVASGDFVAMPFVNDVKLKNTNGVGGILYVDSGINFVNGGGMQYEPYLGPTNISHSGLKNLDSNDHPQYLLRTGGQTMTGNLGLSSNWINSSGSSNITTSTGRGLQFSYVNNTSENINVGSGTSFVYLRDISKMNSAKGVAKAWINFDASGTIVVRDSYNVSGIQRLDAGKFKIIFNSGVFANNNYVAIGSSNATSTSGSKEDFTNNTVGIVLREGNDGTSLRSLTFVVKDEGGQYVNAKLNDLVVYGTEPGGTSQSVSIIS